MGDYSGFNDIARRAVIKAFNNLPANLKKAGPTVGNQPATTPIQGVRRNMMPMDPNNPIRTTMPVGPAVPINQTNPQPPFQNLGLEQMPQIIQDGQTATNPYQQLRMRLMNARTMMPRQLFKS